VGPLPAGGLADPPCDLLAVDRDFRRADEAQLDGVSADLQDLDPMFPSMTIFWLRFLFKTSIATPSLFRVGSVQGTVASSSAFW